VNRTGVGGVRPLPSPVRQGSAIFSLAGVPLSETRIVGRTLCGVPHEDQFDIAAAWQDCFSEQVRTLAREAGLSDSAIKPRYSRTAGRTYESFGCRPQCDSIYGEWFVRHDLCEVVYDPPILVS
jgi:hypothetical protein